MFVQVSSGGTGDYLLGQVRKR